MRFIKWFKWLYALPILFLGLIMFGDTAAAQIRFLGALFGLFAFYFLWTSRKKYWESNILPIMDFLISLSVLLVIATHFVHLLSNMSLAIALAQLFLFLPFELVVIVVILFCVSAPVIFIKRAYRSFKENQWWHEINKWVLIFVVLTLVLVILHFMQPGMTMREIQGFEQQFSVASHHPIKIGLGNHVFLGYSFTGTDYLGKEDFAFPYLDWLIKKLGSEKVDFLRIGVSYDAWALGNKKEQELADKYIQKIREAHIPLFLTDTQHQLYLMGANRLSFDDFAKVQLARTEFFVKRYQPEYYSIVTEVEMYKYNIKDDFDVDKWVAQTEKLSDLVKRISPSTKTVAYINMSDKSVEYFKKVLKIKSLDAVGIDFYSFDDLNKAIKLMDEVKPHDYGKELWLAETYYGLGWPCAPAAKENLDAEWLKMTYEFAQHYNADAYIPWPFEHLLTYNCSTLGQKINFSGQTKVMNELLGIIKDAKSHSNK